MDDTAAPAADPGTLSRTATLAKRMLALARAQRDLAATPADLDTAAGILLRSGPDTAWRDEQLLDAVRDAACARLSATARRDLDAAFAQASGDLEALTGRAPILPAIPALAGLVARAAGLEASAAKALVQRLVAAEQDRRAAARDRARALHDAERRRLREWESEMVGADALPAQLGASRPQVDRWIADGLIPVARSTPVRGGSARGSGRRAEELEFHPDQIAALRPEAARWKMRSADAGEPAEARPRVPNGAIARRAGLDRYAAHFVHARGLARRITVVIGPTNSGKSHYALDRLAAADSGAALAPLRLLALEFQEALAARGVAASLLTGEERDIVPGARHVACTVEMADTSLAELADRRRHLAEERRGLERQQQDRDRLRQQRVQAQAVRANLEAFCTRIQGRLEAPTFADKQAILQLVIERIIVGDGSLEIRHVIPLRPPPQPGSDRPTDPDPQLRTDRVDAAALPCGAHHAANRGLEALVRVGDHQLGAA